jgi:2-phospho-L-lactate guanylyltransferase
MLADVLDVCLKARVVSGVAAVVDTPAARAAVEARGATALTDAGDGDMNAAVRLGVATARARDASTVLVIPGDTPCVSVADLDGLVEAAGAAPRAVVVAASHDGTGTNGLLLRPADVIAPAFGPPSLTRHMEAGLRAGAFTQARFDLGVALDVDTPEDLRALDSATVGPHTTAALAQLTGRSPLTTHHSPLTTRPPRATHA